MASVYIIKGRVLPMRANFTLIRAEKYSFITPHFSATQYFELHISCNEITIYYTTEDNNISIPDIRNLSLNIAQIVVARYGFFYGSGWNVEINQVLWIENGAQNSYVFGVKENCISNRMDKKLIDKWLDCLSRNFDPERSFIDQCFVNLQMAINKPIDTEFYCYRGIECLRHYCRVKYKLGGKNEIQQWAKLTEITGKGIDDIKDLKKAANEARHGNHLPTTGDQREGYFTFTWDLVEAFIESEIIND